MSCGQPSVLSRVLPEAMLSVLGVAEDVLKAYDAQQQQQGYAQQQQQGGGGDGEVGASGVQRCGGGGDVGGCTAQALLPQGVW